MGWQRVKAEAVWAREWKYQKRQRVGKERREHANGEGEEEATIMTWSKRESYNILRCCKNTVTVTLYLSATTKEEEDALHKRVRN